MTVGARAREPALASRTSPRAAAQRVPRPRRRRSAAASPIPWHRATCAPASASSRSLGLGHAAAARRRRARAPLHDRVRQRVALGPQHDDLHAALGRHVHGRGRHGERQRARVITQLSTNLPRRGTPRSSSVFQSASAWHGMVDGRLEVDQRLVAQAGHLPELRVGEVGREVLCRRRTRGCRARRSRRRAPGSPRARARRPRRP